jgi:hypothetical protein
MAENRIKGTSLFSPYKMGKFSLSHRSVHPTFSQVLTAGLIQLLVSISDIKKKKNPSGVQNLERDPGGHFCHLTFVITLRNCPWIQGGAGAHDKMQGVVWDTRGCAGGVLHAEINSWRISHQRRHYHLSNCSRVISSSSLLLMVTFSFLHLRGRCYDRIEGCCDGGGGGPRICLFMVGGVGCLEILTCSLKILNLKLFGSLKILKLFGV